MSTRYLGYSFDIHTGGVDLCFPHHENEIAQSEGVSHKPFVKYWLHNEHLLVDGRKMSKSLGNFFTLRQVLEKGVKPAAVRYLLLATHYRSQLNFTFEAAHAAERTLAGLQDFLDRLAEADGKDDEQLEGQLEKTRDAFRDALDDDLDVATALAAVFELEKKASVALSQGAVSKKAALRIADFFWKEFNAVFAVLEKRKTDVPTDVLALVQRREEARQKKDFKTSDALREKIRALGYAVDDTEKGAKVKKL